MYSLKIKLCISVIFAFIQSIQSSYYYVSSERGIDNTTCGMSPLTPCWSIWYTIETKIFPLSQPTNRNNKFVKEKKNLFSNPSSSLHFPSQREKKDFDPSFPITIFVFAGKYSGPKVNTNLSITPDLPYFSLNCQSPLTCRINCLEDESFLILYRPISVSGFRIFGPRSPMDQNSVSIPRHGISLQIRDEETQKTKNTRQWWTNTDSSEEQERTVPSLSVRSDSNMLIIESSLFSSFTGSGLFVQDFPYVIFITNSVFLNNKQHGIHLKNIKYFNIQKSNSSSNLGIIESCSLGSYPCQSPMLESSGGGSGLLIENPPSLNSVERKNKLIIPKITSEVIINKSSFTDNISYDVGGSAIRISYVTSVVIKETTISQNYKYNSSTYYFYDRPLSSSSSTPLQPHESSPPPSPSSSSFQQTPNPLSPSQLNLNSVTLEKLSPFLPPLEIETEGGAGIYIYQSSAVHIKNSSFISNLAVSSNPSSGALSLSSVSSVDMSQMIFSTNSGLSVTSLSLNNCPDVSISDSSFKNCFPDPSSSPSSVCSFSSSSVVIKDSTIIENSTPYAVSCSYSDFTVFQSQIEDEITCSNTCDIKIDANSSIEIPETNSDTKMCEWHIDGDDDDDDVGLPILTLSLILVSVCVGATLLIVTMYHLYLFHTRTSVLSNFAIQS